MIEIIRWGLIDYQKATSQQLEWVQQRQADLVGDTVILCTHPPVVTLGRSTPKNDLVDWQGSVVESSRGGRATYHGPNQLVVYPIIDLHDENRRAFKSRDLHGYLRALETSIVAGLKKWRVDAEVRTTTMFDDSGKKLLLTGVWVGEHKVASIGVAVKKWVTYHGVAINLYEDVDAFKGIKPCGFAPEVMTSVEKTIGSRPDREQFENDIAQSVVQHLS